MTDQHTVQAGTQTIAVRKDLRVPMRDGITLAADTYSAGRFVADARAAQQDVESRGLRAFFVGGTSLYYKTYVYGMLEGPSADPALRDPVRWQAGDVDAIVMDASGRQRQHAGDQVEDRRLAGPVRTDQAADLSGRERQADAVDGADAAETLGDLGELQHLPRP